MIFNSCRCGRSQRLWGGGKFAGPESGNAAGLIFLLVRNATNTISVSNNFQPLSAPCQKWTSKLKTLLPSTTWPQAPAGRWSSNKEVPTTSTTGLPQGRHQNNQNNHICHFLFMKSSTMSLICKSRPCVFKGSHDFCWPSQFCRYYLQWNFQRLRFEQKILLLTDLFHFCG